MFRRASGTTNKRRSPNGIQSSTAESLQEALLTRCSRMFRKASGTTNKRRYPGVTCRHSMIHLIIEQCLEQRSGNISNRQQYLRYIRFYLGLIQVAAYFVVSKITVRQRLHHSFYACAVHIRQPLRSLPGEDNQRHTFLFVVYLGHALVGICRYYREGAYSSAQFRIIPI